MQNLTANDTASGLKEAAPGIPGAIKVNYPYISKILLFFFCGYVIAWYLQIGYRIQPLGAIRFEFIYAATLILIAFFFTPRIDTDCPIIPYVILYFIAIIVQVPFSSDFDMSFNIFIDRIVKFAFMAFFIVAFVRSPLHLKFFLAAFLLACLKMGQEGLIGRITGGLIWENQGVMRLHGSTPLYDHPNSFAGMALGTLPFIYYLWSHVNRYIKIILVAIAILSMNIVVYTGSRTGYVGLIVFLTFIFTKSKDKMKIFMALLLIIIICIPFVPSDYIERFESIFTGKEKEGSSTEARIEILRDAWQIFIEHPFGVGVAAFPKVRMETFGRSQDTHNLYLEIATNLGIQGLIVVLLFFYKMLSVLKTIRLSARRTIAKIDALNNFKDNKAVISDLEFIESAALATSAFVIIRLTLGLFGMDLYEIYWWFALGMTIALHSMLRKIEMAI
jgi:putative inorganic carbon (hco3(-)) transporter